VDLGGHYYSDSVRAVGLEFNADCMKLEAKREQNNLKCQQRWVTLNFYFSTFSCCMNRWRILDHHSGF